MKSKNRESADTIVAYLQRDDRTKDLVQGSDAWAFEEAITKAIESMQAEADAESACCAFCGA